MSLIQKIKRAAKDQNAYNGPTDNDNWTQVEINAWSYLCDKFGGHFSIEPNTFLQNKSFMDFLDKYEDKEYTNTIELSAPSGNGADLRGLIPEKQKVNVEGLSKKDAQLKEAVINQNANVKLPDTMKPLEPIKSTPVSRKLVPTPREVLKTEPEVIEDASNLPLETNKEISQNDADKGIVKSTDTVVATTTQSSISESRRIREQYESQIREEPKIVKVAKSEPETSKVLPLKEENTKTRTFIKKGSGAVRTR